MVSYYFSQIDSGGPLMQAIRESDAHNNDIRKYYAVGINSFGNKCGKKAYPAVYAKIKYYLDFIDEILENNK